MNSLTYMLKEDMEFPTGSRLLVHMRGIRTDVAEKLVELEDRLEACGAYEEELDVDDLEERISRMEEDIKSIKAALNSVIQNLMDAADGLEEVE